MPQEVQPTRTERYEAIVIGGGQSGLAAGYELQRRGVDFLILDAGAYLDAFAAHVDLPVRLGAPVRSLRRAGSRYEMLVGDRKYEASSVIVATGFTRDLRWIELPILDVDGLPRHRDGIVDGAVEGEPGLYLLGVHFRRTPSSEMIGGVARDAVRIAEQVAERLAGEAP